MISSKCIDYSYRYIIWGGPFYILEEGLSFFRKKSGSANQDKNIRALKGKKLIKINIGTGIYCNRCLCYLNSIPIFAS